MKPIKGIKSFLAILFLTAVLFYGCKRNEIYPVIPSITFKDSYVLFDQSNRDSLVVLILSYKDGDGDIGLDANLTSPPYHTDTLGPNASNTNRFANNIFIDYYDKRGPQYYILVNPFLSGDTIRKDVRVGNLTPDGQHKAIRGDIKVEFLPSSYSNRSDTIKLKARIADRALHVSNEVESPDIYLVNH